MLGASAAVAVAVVFRFLLLPLGSASIVNYKVSFVNYVDINRYFGGVGAEVEVITKGIDYFSMQGEIADVSARLSGLGDKSPYIQVWWYVVPRS